MKANENRRITAFAFVAVICALIASGTLQSAALTPPAPPLPQLPLRWLTRRFRIRTTCRSRVRRCITIISTTVGKDVLVNELPPPPSLRTRGH